MHGSTPPVKTTPLGPLGDVSRLTLGGGGIGQGWGETSRDEAMATLRAAVDGGIDLIDTAPLYRNCEAIVAETFNGALPAGVKITTKCGLGSPPAGQAAARLEASLAASLAAMRLARVDIYFLHSNIAPDDYAYAHGDARRDDFSTRWSLYADEVVGAFERLKAEGRIGAWGITGVGLPSSIRDAIAHDPRPDVAQVVANLMDSAGGLRRFAEPADPRAILAAAGVRGVGVMGIRAVQAGALTRQIDRAVSPNHPDARDYERARPFRKLCERWGEDPALIAHRYALSIPGVDTLVLGVKNRAELDQAFRAEAAGPLSGAEIAEIDQLGLRI
jgi:aryl-alcohol dehydrogenase-like predicted oxidoreductase